MFGVPDSAPPRELTTGPMKEEHGIFLQDINRYEYKINDK
jgi:hypothetical protein